MDAETREDIAVAVATHHDLGKEYDAAIAESLVERIGTEIDKRVDARLAKSGDQPPVGRPAWFQLVMGLGSVSLGIIGTEGLLNTGRTLGLNGLQGTQVGLVALVWIVIAVINVAYARRP